jgi:hypothetical protein
MVRRGIGFEGVEEGIRVLAQRLPLMIVSNCQSAYIEVFRATSGLDACVVDHECWGNTGRSEGENLRAIIARNSAERPVFVGDTDGDQLAAQQTPCRSSTPPTALARCGARTPCSTASPTCSRWYSGCESTRHRDRGRASSRAQRLSRRVRGVRAARSARPAKLRQGALSSSSSMLAKPGLASYGSTPRTG